MAVSNPHYRNIGLNISDANSAAPAPGRVSVTPNVRAMTRQEFMGILETDIAKNIFSKDDVAAATKSFSDEQKAALLHFNGITKESDTESANDMMHLFAAFHSKDAGALAIYLDKGVSTGVRLDYGLPLYSERNRSGEDIYVCAVKAMLGGGAALDIDIEDKGLQGYVQNSFKIRDMLKNAPNKAPVQPTPGAIEYILDNSATYRDSNNNPVIVFIPGVIDVDQLPVEDLIEKTLNNGANVNDIGFFDVPGIVWSVIQADVEAVKAFLKHGADINLAKPDSFGNKSVTTWATVTLAAASDDSLYATRMAEIFGRLASQDNFLTTTNNLNKTPLEYLPEEYNYLKNNLSGTTALSMENALLKY